MVTSPFITFWEVWPRYSCCYRLKNCSDSPLIPHNAAPTKPLTFLTSYLSIYANLMIIRPRPLFCQYLPDVVKKNIILAWVQSTIFVLQCLLRRSAKVLYWIKATNTSLYPLSMLWRVLLLTIVDRFFVMWWWWLFKFAI